MIRAASAAIIEQQKALCDPDVYSPTGELLNPAPCIEYDVEDIDAAALRGSAGPRTVGTPEPTCIG